MCSYFSWFISEFNDILSVVHLPVQSQFKLLLFVCIGKDECTCMYKGMHIEKKKKTISLLLFTQKLRRQHVGPTAEPLATGPSAPHTNDGY